MIKLKNILILFFVFLFFSTAEAVDICGDRVYLNISASGECGTTPTECAPVTGCSVGSPGNIGCTSYTCEICCPDTDNQQRDDASNLQIITDVEAGQEQSTAQTAFNDWEAVTEYPTAPAGYTMTGSLQGFVYTTGQADNPDEVDLFITMWKRGFYTKQGAANIVPIENIGSDNAIQTIASGVGSAIDSKFGVYESDSAGHLTYNTQDPFQSGRDEGDLEGLADWSNEAPVVADDIVTKIQNFITTNPVLDVFKTSTWTKSGDSCSFQVEVFGSDMIFSFCEYESHFLLLGTMILALATLYSLFVVLGKG